MPPKELIRNAYLEARMREQAWAVTFIRETRTCICFSLSLSLSLSMYIYVYIYIYIQMYTHNYLDTRQFQQPEPLYAILQWL